MNFAPPKIQIMFVWHQGCFIAVEYVTDNMIMSVDSYT